MNGRRGGRPPDRTRLTGQLANLSETLAGADGAGRSALFLPDICWSLRGRREFRLLIKRSIMRTSAHYSSHSRATLPFSALESTCFEEELVAGERIGAPLRRTRGRRFLRSMLLLALLGGAGYVVSWDPAAWWQRAQWLGTQAASLTALLESRPPASLERPRPVALPDFEPAQTEHIRAAAAADPPLAVGSSPADMAPPKVAATETEVEPLPPPVIDPNDPYQRRAEAVGLHPGLSRVLLARLSAADYRNAEHAISTAIAKTPDGGVFTWPRQRTPDLAVFKVHFVRGVTPECRRYVVTVTKDGWITTALPMERCGPNLRQAMRK